MSEQTFEARPQTLLEPAVETDAAESEQPGSEQPGSERPEHDDVALWRSQLVELEYQARAALRSPERMRTWMPDPRLGPVPAEVVPELQRVIGVYADVIQHLGRDRAALAAELRASSRAAALVAPPTAVYLDVRG